jgi:nucleolar protein 56
MEYLFEHITGFHVFDEKGNHKKTYNNKEEINYDNYNTNITEELYQKILLFLKKESYLKEMYIKNIYLTRKDIKKSVYEDNLIIQSIRIIDDLNKVINHIAKRLREWYELHNPEFSKTCPDNERFVKIIIDNNKKELLEKINIDYEVSMGCELKEEDITIIKILAKEIERLIELKDIQKEYIEKKMNNICPNLLSIAGPLIGAKLIEHAGSLKHLSELPGSTIQLLGAEKALFRHIKSGAKCPKYGVLLNHPYVRDSPEKRKGKSARILADKISIAVKVDYFKGEFIADYLKEQLEKKKKDIK